MTPETRDRLLVHPNGADIVALVEAIPRLTPGQLGVLVAAERERVTARPVGLPATLPLGVQFAVLAAVDGLYGREIRDGWPPREAVLHAVKAAAVATHFAGVLHEETCARLRAPWTTATAASRDTRPPEPLALFDVTAETPAAGTRPQTGRTAR